MAEEDCLHYVQQANAAKFIQLGFSGGEPFLFLPTISKVMAAAIDAGISTSITTNCFWAINDQRALEILSPLKEAGLTSLNLSTSEFHLEFIPAARILSAARAANQLGLSVRINCVLSDRFSAETFSSLLAGIEFVEFVHIPCVPTSRAGTLVSIRQVTAQNRIPEGSCRQHFTKIAITAEGDAYPCCSPGGFTEPLKLGNLRQEDLVTITDRARTSGLHQILDLVGPSFFVPFIRSFLGPSALNEAFVDQCHLCHHIMSNPETRSIVFSVIEQLKRECEDISRPASLHPKALVSSEARHISHNP